MRRLCNSQLFWRKSSFHFTLDILKHLFNFQTFQKLEKKCYYTSNDEISAGNNRRKDALNCEEAPTQKPSCHFHDFFSFHTVKCGSNVHWKHRSTPGKRNPCQDVNNTADCVNESKNRKPELHTKALTQICCSIVFLTLSSMGKFALWGNKDARLDEKAVFMLWYFIKH